MKNVLVVELDTDNQTSPITLKKPEGFIEPNSAEEAAQILFADISTLVNGLGLLIKLVEDSGLAQVGQLKKDVVAALDHMLPDVVEEDFYNEPTEEKAVDAVSDNAVENQL